MGVEVEAFSIGWGPRIAGFKRGGTEWRISAFPIGGYCKMKGEESFRKALEDKARELPRENGSYLRSRAVAAHRHLLRGPPRQRRSSPSSSSSLVLDHRLRYADLSQQDRPPERVRSGRAAALGATRPTRRASSRGDRIVAADGKPIADFSDLLESITLSANKPVAPQDRAGRNDPTTRPSRPCWTRTRAAASSEYRIGPIPIVGDGRRGERRPDRGHRAGRPHRLHRRQESPVTP